MLRTFVVLALLAAPGLALGQEATEQASPAAVASEPGGKPASRGFFARPGTWVAGAGVVLVGVGAGFGASAQSTKDKAVDADGNGALDVSRVDAQDSESSATLANVFFAVGGAAVAGGLTWALLDGPSAGPAPEPVRVTPDPAPAPTPPAPDPAPAPPQPGPGDDVPLVPLVPQARAPSPAPPALAIAPFGLGLQAIGHF